MSETPPQRVLVTGSNRGIGRAIALELAKSGYALTVHYKTNREAAEETLKLLQAFEQPTTLLTFDVRDRAQCESILNQDIEKNGAYFGAVLNAGAHEDAPFPMLPFAAW